uniref:AlNc14C21G2197 protein n=1 Tax=Albugo laibachii Nc14 TaxID=890382 RepID=F0W5N2_9STRA|nr:AlNc14C21G2197 [Albugo laibachii Nc14]|eukprot:CCA16423.1 AlNc14C21G2197 [Albugo laibachii Nc14]
MFVFVYWLYSIFSQHMADCVYENATRRNREMTPISQFISDYSQKISWEETDKNVIDPL